MFRNFLVARPCTTCVESSSQAVDPMSPAMQTGSASVSQFGRHSDQTLEQLLQDVNAAKGVTSNALLLIRARTPRFPSTLAAHQFMASV